MSCSDMKIALQNDLNARDGGQCPLMGGSGLWDTGHSSASGRIV